MRSLGRVTALLLVAIFSAANAIGGPGDSPSPMPSSCIEQFDPELENQRGATIPLPKNAVEILHTTGDTALFRVSQLWTTENEDANLIAIHYHNNIGSTSCVPTFNLSHANSITLTAYCYCGFTDMSVYVYLDELDDDYDDCNSCKSPSDEDDSTIAAYFVSLVHMLRQ